MRLLAQSATPLGKIGGTAPGDTSLGPFGNINFSGTSALQAVTRAISSIIGLMTVAAAIWFLFQFIIGGFSWVTSGGDKAKVQQAQQRLSNAFIGLVVVVAGWAILALAGQFFGYDIILSKPANVINQIKLR